MTNSPPTVIEGDFIEDKNGLIFDVKGFNHPKDRAIAFIRYIPFELLRQRLLNFLHSMTESVSETENSQYTHWLEDFNDLISSTSPNFMDSKDEIISELNRIFGFKVPDLRIRNDGRVYIKIYDLQTRFNVLSYIQPDYIFCPNNYDFPLQAVPFNKIIRHYKPETFLSEKIADIGTLDNNFMKRLVTFKKWLEERTNMNLNGKLGLSGSLMVGLNKDQSDYDLIVYGRDSAMQIRKCIGKLIRNKKGEVMAGGVGIVHPYDYETLQKLYEVRGKNSRIPFKIFKRYEIRKQHQCLIDDTEVFLRYLEYSREEYASNRTQDFKNNRVRTLGRISFLGKITDGSLSMFTPAKYGLIIKEIKELKLRKEEISEARSDQEIVSNNQLIEIHTWRGRFIEQARVGEEVFVCGKLEETLENTKEEPAEKLNVILGGHMNDMFYPTRYDGPLQD